MPRALVVAACIIAAACAVPGAASAATAPPVLQSPAAAASVRQGNSVTYTWTGALLGDVTTSDQAYFVVQVIDASQAPTGQQADWPDADTSNQTPSGQTVDSLDLGAPPTGTWKWRVCGWGVVDPSVSVTVQQIPNGCSAARTLTSASALSTNGSDVQVINEQHHVTVAAAPTIIQKIRPATNTAPADVNPAAPKVTPIAATPAPAPEPIQPIKIEQRSADAVTSSGVRKSSIGLSNASGIGDASDSSQAAARTSGGSPVSSALVGGLSATIPGIPVPFWVLLFLIACVPIAIVWRRSVLAMFEWSDGSIDGFGTPDARGAASLVSIQHDQSTHAFGGAADGAASPFGTITEAPITKRAA